MEGSFPVKLIKGEPATIIGKTLVIADLHIGIEREYWRAGVRASGLSRKVGEAVERILERTKPKRIIVAGDFKHNIPDFTLREAEEVRRIAEVLSSQGELLVIKGNHDGDIEKIIPWVTVYPGSGTAIDGVYILHGHARPADDVFDAKVAVMGHIHPAIQLRHKFGGQMVKVFLLARWKGVPVVILPAFSPLITGMDVSRAENLIGPVAKDFETVDAFLLDGTYVRRVL